MVSVTWSILLFFIILKKKKNVKAVLNYKERAWPRLLTLPTLLPTAPCLVGGREAGRGASPGEALFVLMRTPLVLNTLGWEHSGTRSPQSMHSLGSKSKTLGKGPPGVHHNQGPHVRKLSHCELK